MNASGGAACVANFAARFNFRDFRIGHRFRSRIVRLSDAGSEMDVNLRRENLLAAFRTDHDGIEKLAAGLVLMQKRTPAHIHHVDARADQWTSHANLFHEPLNPRCEAETDDTMPDQLPLFEIRLRPRRRVCRWYLCTSEGDAIMQGLEGSRTAARYQASRALFLMLLASAYRPL